VPSKPLALDKAGERAALPTPTLPPSRPYYFTSLSCHRSLLARPLSLLRYHIRLSTINAPSSLFRILRARRNPLLLSPPLAAAAPLLAHPRPRLNSPSSTTAPHIAPHRTFRHRARPHCLTSLAPDTASTLVASASSCNNALAPCARQPREELALSLQQRKLATTPPKPNKEPVLPYTPAVYFQTKQLSRLGTRPATASSKNTLF
jgi:hypothetical protein